jgi:hypothetical protein
MLADVRFGSKADMRSAKRDVRFTPRKQTCFAPQEIESVSRSKPNVVMWLKILGAIKRCDSNLPTIVCPVQQSLPLPRAAKWITGLAVYFDLIATTGSILAAMNAGMICFGFANENETNRLLMA